MIDRNTEQALYKITDLPYLKVLVLLYFLCAAVSGGYAQTTYFSPQDGTETASLNDVELEPSGDNPKGKMESANGKFALIIANGKYEEATLWPDLSSLQDVPLLSDALIKKGFPKENIYVLRDGTHLAIDSAFKSFKEILSPNASVYVHYSGHGQQIFDDSSDEVDGYDEAIVPVNAPFMFREGIYEGEYHIRDEKLGTYLDDIRQKIGDQGSVIFVLDACHSGTGTRGINRHRGATQPFQPEGYVPRGEQETQYGMRSENASLAPLICFYASSPNESNYEYQLAPGEYIGSLSLAVSKALSDAGPKTTYRSLFDKIKLTMSVIAPSQTPMSEGLSDQVILGGELLEPVKYYSVTKASAKEGTVFGTTDGGQLAGIYEGSKLAFYPIGSYDIANQEAMTAGTVIYSDLLTADVKLDEPIDPNVLEGLWAVVEEYNYGNLALRVQVATQNDEFNDVLAAKLEQYKLINLTDEAPDLVIENVPQSAKSRGAVSKKDFQIYSKNDEVLWKEEVPKEEIEAATDRIIPILIDYTQTRFLRKLELVNPAFNASLRLEPLTGEEIGSRFITKSVQPLESKLDEGGNIVFQEGDYFRMRVKNNGTKTLYFTVLDIQPDNKLNVLLPYENESPADFSLAPGRDYVSREFKLNPPYGTEVFKLIATERPLNLSGIIATRGGGDQPTQGPLDLLISDSFKSDKTETRGATTNLPTGAANIESVVFKIEP